MEIAKNIYFVGISISKEEDFENLWELDNGVSYNSYLINGERKVLIDSCPEKYFSILKENIEKICPIEKLSYLVLNHLEPDHSGSIKFLLDAAPELQILATKMGKNMIFNYYGIKERVKEVKEGEVLDLGGFTIKFISTPFIHWPETMMTFEETSKTLFSCDCFGGFGELKQSLFAEEKKEGIWEEERYRYFVNVLSSCSKHIEKVFPKLEAISPWMICPSHGYLFKDPRAIFETYKKWCGYSTENCENYAPVVASSMYGVSLQAANYISKAISEKGINSQTFDLSSTPISYILKEIHKAKGLAIVSPTYEGGIFPKTADFLFRAKAKEIKNKKVVFAGSFGWSGGALKEFEDFCKSLNWEIVRAFEFKGSSIQYSEKLRELSDLLVESFNG